MEERLFVDGEELEYTDVDQLGNSSSSNNSENDKIKPYSLRNDITFF